MPLIRVEPRKTVSCRTVLPAAFSMCDAGVKRDDAFNVRKYGIYLKALRKRSRSIREPKLEKDFSLTTETV